MTERTRNLVVRLADDELQMMRAIAEAERETAATLIRRWIRQRAEVLGIGMKATENTGPRKAQATTKGRKR